MRPPIDVPTLSALMSRLPAQHFSSLVHAWADYAKTVQQEDTRREEIAAKEKVALERLAVLRELWSSALREAFIERRENFRALFEQLDKTIESRDPATVTALAAAITEIAKTSPLRDLATTQRDLADPTKRFEI